MMVLEFLLSIFLIVAILIIILGFISTRYGVAEKNKKIEQQDKLIKNLNNQILELHKKIRKKKSSKENKKSGVYE